MPIDQPKSYRLSRQIVFCRVVVHSGIMFEIDPAYPTILPVFQAWILVGLLNLLAPIVVANVVKRMGRYGWVAHVIAILWILSSPLQMVYLAGPVIPPDEEPGPGDGLILLPILLESLGLLSMYALFVLTKVLAGCMRIYRGLRMQRPS